MPKKKSSPVKTKTTGNSQNTDYTPVQALHVDDNPPLSTSEYPIPNKCEHNDELNKKIDVLTEEMNQMKVLINNINNGVIAIFEKQQIAAQQSISVDPQTKPTNLHKIR